MRQQGLEADRRTLLQLLEASGEMAPTFSRSTSGQSMGSSAVGHAMPNGAKPSSGLSQRPGYVSYGQPLVRRESTQRVLGSAMIELEEAERKLRPIECGPVEGNDEALLAALGDMAHGANDDWDALSSGVLDFLPMEVQFDDPPVKALIFECAAAWEELQKAKLSKQKHQKKKLGEIRKVKEHRKQQHQESVALQERLFSAQEQVVERLDGGRTSEQSMRERIEEERCAIEELAQAPQGDLLQLRERAALVEQRVKEESLAQERMQEEVREAIDETVELRAELASSEESVLAERSRFARLQATLAEEQRAAGLSHQLLRSELEQFQRSQSSPSSSPVHPSSTFNISSAFADTGSSPKDEEPKDEEELGINDANGMLVSKLEQRCWRQKRQLQVLRDRLVAEESSMRKLHDKLEQYGSVRNIFALEGMAPDEGFASEDIADACGDLSEESLGTSITAIATEAQALQEELLRRQAEFESMAVTERESHDALGAELAQLTDMQERLLDAEETAEQQERILAEENRKHGILREAVKSEQEVCSVAERTAQEQWRRLQLEIEEKRTMLKNKQDDNRRLLSGRKKKKG